MNKNNTKDIKLIWFIACNSSSVDVDTNNISLNGIIEQLKIEKLVPISGKEIKNIETDIPEKGITIPINMEFVGMWHKLANKDEAQLFDAKVEIIDPNNKVLQTVIHKLELKPGIERLRSRVRMGGFVFTKPGIYLITLSLKDGDKFKKFGEISLPVRFG